MSNESRSYPGRLRSSAPVVGGALITPSDSADLATETRGIYIGATAGDLTVTFVDGTIVTVPVLANTIYPFAVRRIWSTGTTATTITALY